MRCLLVFLCLMGSGLTTLLAQDPVFRSSTSLVRIDAQAVDPSGRMIPGLKASDFRVFDQGILQTLTGFSFDEEPLDLILLFDVSSGMKEKIHSILRATELGFHELHAGDRVCVMSYDVNSRLVQPFTEDLAAVNEAILLRVLSSHFGGSAHVEVAAAEAAVRFRSEPATHRKRAILAITDKPEADRAGVRAALQELWAGNIVFSELILGKSASAPRLVESTGGTLITASVPGEAFQQSVHYLRSGYALYYAQPDAPSGSERSVRVEVAAPNARVHARSGYTVP